jgi:hypothetical protein
MIKYIALMLFCNSVLADGVYIGAVSKHFLINNQTNETHELMIIEHNNYIVGGFVNSFDDVTFLTAKDYNCQYNDFKLGMFVGAAYGYSCGDVAFCYKSFTPVVSPYISYTEYKIQPTVAIIGSAVFLTVKITY